MNKEKLIQLRKRVNELFFKKNYPSDILARKNICPENLL